MKIIPHNSTMVQEALRKAKKLGELNNSITKGHGNAAGYLGEESVASYLNADVVTNRNHDLVLNNKTIEVKTKRRTVKPQDSYEVSISKTSLHQQPDVYVFVSLQFESRIKDGKNKGAYKGLQHVWLLGSKTPEEYFKAATLWKKGTVDPSNNFKTHADMYNLPISELDEVIL